VRAFYAAMGAMAGDKLQQAGVAPAPAPARAPPQAAAAAAPPAPPAPAPPARCKIVQLD
jgi:hypothetical protein